MSTESSARGPKDPQAGWVQLGLDIGILVSDVAASQLWYRIHFTGMCKIKAVFKKLISCGRF